MKLKSILINTLGIILACFAFACGEEYSSSQNNDSAQKSEEADAQAEDITMNEKKSVMKKEDIVSTAADFVRVYKDVKLFSQNYPKNIIKFDIISYYFNNHFTSTYRA